MVAEFMILFISVLSVDLCSRNYCCDVEQRRVRRLFVYKT